MRALRFRWVVGIVFCWWATVLAVMLAFTLFPPSISTSAVPEPAVGHGLDIIVVCPPPFTSTEQLVVVALSAPVAFCGLWLLARGRRG